jgi:hypothetical protein
LYMKIGGFFGENNSYIIKSDKSVIFYNGIGHVPKDFKTNYINKYIVRKNNQIYRLKANGHHPLLEKDIPKKIYVCHTGNIIMISNDRLILHVDGCKLIRNIEGLDMVKCITCNSKSVILVSKNKFAQHGFFGFDNPNHLEFVIPIENPIDIVPGNNKYTFVILNEEGQLWLVNTFIRSAKLIHSPVSDNLKIIEIRITNIPENLLVRQKNLLWTHYNIYTNVSGMFSIMAFDLELNCTNGDILYLA